MFFVVLGSMNQYLRSVKIVYLMALVTLLALLLLLQLDHVINSENCNGSLSGELETLNLGHDWLKDASSAVISDLALKQVQTKPDKQQLKIN